MENPQHDRPIDDFEHHCMDELICNRHGLILDLFEHFLQHHIDLVIIVLVEIMKWRVELKVPLDVLHSIIEQGVLRERLYSVEVYFFIFVFFPVLKCSFKFELVKVI